MTDNLNVREEILGMFPFLDGDPRWSGAVELVRRTVNYPDGNVRTYTDLKLKIGTRWLTLPRRGCEEIIQAIEACKDAAETVHSATTTAPPIPDTSSVSSNRRRVFTADRNKGRRGGRNTESE